MGARLLVALNLAFEIADRDVVAAVTAQARAEYEGASAEVQPTADTYADDAYANERLGQLIERLDEALDEQMPAAL